MQPEPPEPGSARDWLRRARSDFALARVGPQPDVMYNELCFHAQQTVEKCLKAILVDRKIEFPRVHNIAYLFRLLPSDVDLPSAAMEAMGLTTYAVMTRYPGDYEEITPEMYHDAIRVAYAILYWAECVVG